MTPLIVMDQRSVIGAPSLTQTPRSEVSENPGMGVRIQSERVSENPRNRQFGSLLRNRSGECGAPMRKLSQDIALLVIRENVEVNQVEIQLVGSTKVWRLESKGPSAYI